MHRCLQLAQLGSGSVAPNPMVGAVLVYEDNIIGEGYHQKYGEAHAEVNCINSVKEEHKDLIEQSTLYVSLEPCAHFGKTPPCADLIIRNKIPRVVIGCRDPFVQVDGKGIEKLKAAGVEVFQDVLQKECKDLNTRFFTFHTKYRPYVVLKWAETADGKIAARPPQSPEGGLINTQPLPGGETVVNKSTPQNEVGERANPPLGRMSRLFISNTYTNRIVHKWRSEEMAIAVGTNTALYDDPELNTRLWPGKNPIRIVVDMELRLPQSLKLFNGSSPTIVFNYKKHTIENVKSSLQNGVHYCQVTEDVSLVHQMLNALYSMNIQSLLIEGGAYLLQSFIDEGLWDEARVITNEELIIGKGLPAPVLQHHQLLHTEKFFSDTVRTYQLINQSTF
jgi:diaminohydroxyphosphoribosylaminopyrimidine deaminase / 5-amino-6-(5-phosphoribosylamino)uracil reductase